MSQERTPRGLGSDDQDAAPSERRLAQAMLALALAVFAGAASMRCLDTSLPALAKDFGLSVGSAGSAVSAYALSYSVGQLFYGPLADRVGAYRVVVWAACLSALTALACAFATSFAELVVLRFVAGSVAAAVGPLTLAWVSQSTSPHERSIAFARMTAAAILGAAGGQVGGGVIGGLIGRPFIFVAVSVLFAASGLALTLIARRSSEVLDHTGPVARTEGRRSNPLSLLRRAAVMRVLAAVAIEGFAVYLSLTYVGGLLRDRLSIGSVRAGLVVSLYGVGGITFALLAPQLLRRLTTRCRAAAAGAILGAGFVALGLSTSQATAAASLFAIGFGFLMLHNIMQMMATKMAPDAIGTSISLFAAVSSLSQGLGAAAGGYVFDRGGPTTACLISAATLIGLGFVLAAKERL